MLKQGAADYLEKPINSYRLQEALERAQVLTLKRAQLYAIKKLGGVLKSMLAIEVNKKSMLSSLIL